MSDSSFIEIPLVHQFSLSDTLKSGQLFHWESLELEGIQGFAGCIGNAAPSWIAQPDANKVVVLASELDRTIRYFGLDQDLQEIHGTFPPDDPVLEKAMAYCPGIRIARQPLWECLATFITSSLKQVAHIRAISLKVRSRFGNGFELGGQEFFAYPSPEVMAGISEDDLRACSLGYRAKSLALAGKAIAEGSINLDLVETTEDESLAREELMKLHGVGEKIANCSLLFGCGNWGAFPIDVWIERILRDQYRKRVKGAKLQDWAINYFGPNAGYAQQYLFHFARKTL
tara:strand:- start:7566 stop:8423 length:858 start_codon:yes stop_codon:yes gene_type:complete